MTTTNGVKKDDFKKEIDGKQVELFILKNNSGLEVSITSYGGRIVTLIVPDKDKKPTNVVLAYPTIDEFLTKKGYFGALVGRVANRIAAGKFTLDKKEYQLEINNPPNIVHGGSKGFSNVVWDAVQVSETKLQLTYLSPHLDQGFPGNLKTVVVYELTNDGTNKLSITYEATTDQETILNLTNHSFFNLSGVGNENIEKHLLTINADHYTPTNEVKIPTGEIAPVAGTPFDFTTPHPIGERIGPDADHIQVQRANGYDHNFALNRPKDAGDTSLFAVKATSLLSGITLEVFTTEPGLQFFSGNSIGRAAFTLQTQHYPDSINHPNFPSVVLAPGAVFRSATVWSFTA